MSVQCYTAVVGDHLPKRTDIQCFVDEGIFVRPVMAAKTPKLLPHLYLADASISIWVDHNIRLLVDPQEVVDAFLGDADLALFSHSYRQNVFQEFATLREQKRFRIPWLQQQLAAQEAAYREAGLPADTPLFENNFLVRRNNERTNQLNEAWLSQVIKWQWRDQVSLPYVLWKSDVKVAAHPFNIRTHEMFRYESQY